MCKVGLFKSCANCCFSCYEVFSCRYGLGSHLFKYQGNYSNLIAGKRKFFLKF